MEELVTTTGLLLYEMSCDLRLKALLCDAAECHIWAPACSAPVTPLYHSIGVQLCRDRQVLSCSAERVQDVEAGGRKLRTPHVELGGVVTRSELPHRNIKEGFPTC